jgi:hypothetical protein
MRSRKVSLNAVLYPVKVMASKNGHFSASVSYSSLSIFTKSKFISFENRAAVISSKSSFCSTKKEKDVEEDSAKVKNPETEVESSSGSKSTFQDMLKRLKQQGAAGTKQETEGKSSSESANEATDNNSYGESKASRLYNSMQDYWYSFVDNVKLAYAEMTDSDEVKESALKRKVAQSESFRRPKENKNEENENTEEKPAYDGPSAIVLVKEPETAWEKLKSRLGDSPLIREMLKNSKKIADAAGSTPIGQQAQKMSQSVKDKIEVLPPHAHSHAFILSLFCISLHTC